MPNSSSAKSPRKAIILVVDRLSAGRISAYGNTCYNTENFNRLAAKSIVFEQAITESTNLSDAYSQIFLSAKSAQSGSPQDSWWDSLKTSGGHSYLITDDPELLDHSCADEFEQVVPIEVIPATKLADSTAETELAQFFAQAAAWISEMPDETVAWIHCRGLSAAWDAPFEMREKLADEEDPTPPDFFEPPHCQFDAATDDPDILLGYQQACVAQMELLDDFLGVVLDQLDQPNHEETLFGLMSTRGYPLGEHGIVGDEDIACDKNSQSYSESAQIPMMVSLPVKSFASSRMVRCHSLIQPSAIGDLVASFMAADSERTQMWLKPFVDQLPLEHAEVAIFQTEHEQAIQTHAWKLILNRETDGAELFAKPDDFWEVNDVSRRCPGVVEQLTDLLNRQTTQRTPVDLPDELASRD